LAAVSGIKEAHAVMFRQRAFAVHAQRRFRSFSAGELHALLFVEGFA
jgi:hypothetical protein